MSLDESTKDFLVYSFCMFLLVVVMVSVAAWIRGLFAVPVLPVLPTGVPTEMSY